MIFLRKAFTRTPYVSETCVFQWETFLSGFDVKLPEEVALVGMGALGGGGGPDGSDPENSCSLRRGFAHVYTRQTTETVLQGTADFWEVPVEELAMNAFVVAQMLDTNNVCWVSDRDGTYGSKRRFRKHK